MKIALRDIIDKCIILNSPVLPTCQILIAESGWAGPGQVPDQQVSMREKKEEEV